MCSVIVGYAWFFERIVVYGPFSNVRTLFRSKRMRKRAGLFLGVVKGLIPIDPFRVLYEYHTHTEAFKKRQKERAWFKRHHMSRRKMRYDLKFGRQKRLR